MKKILLGAMIASVALAASATEVPSANVVGYTKINLTGGQLNCVALQFYDVGATDSAASIANLTSTGLTAGSYDTMNTEAPCIMFYDGAGGYDYFYYISDAYDADGNMVTTWADANGDETDIAKFLGSGFWFKVPEATCTTGTLIHAGEVSNAESLTINIASGLTLAGNPFPAGLDLSKVTTEGLEPGIYDTMNTEAPCVMVYDGAGGYNYFYYISDAYDADGNMVIAWADANSDAIVGVVAKQGEAFWARSSTVGTLTFTIK